MGWIVCERDKNEGERQYEDMENTTHYIGEIPEFNASTSEFEREILL